MKQHLKSVFYSLEYGMPRASAAAKLTRESGVPELGQALCVSPLD